MRYAASTTRTQYKDEKAVHPQGCCFGQAKSSHCHHKQSHCVVITLELGTPAATAEHQTSCSPALHHHRFDAILAPVLLCTPDVVA